MMTSKITQMTARQTLGKAIRFYREERRLSRHDLADRVGCSVGDIEDWERGKSAPPDHKWGRLCKMLHDSLAPMRPMRQRARAEDEQDRAALRGAMSPLMTKPFANLTLVPPAAPAPITVAPEPVNITPALIQVAPAPINVTPPETLHDDGFDLRPAYKAVAKLPEGWRSTEAVTARRAFATDLIKRGWTNEEIRSEVKRKHGVGIELTVLAKLRTSVREAAAAAHRKAREAAPMATNPSFMMSIDTRAPMPEPTTKPEPEPMPVVETHIVEPPAAKPETDVETVARLLLEAIPNLKSFRLEVSDDGEVSIDHTVREVKVVEKTGSLKLKR